VQEVPRKSAPHARAIHEEIPPESKGRKQKTNKIMKLIAHLPFVSVLDGDESSVCAWESNENVCEYDLPECVVNGTYFGTDDSREPKFCQRHFFGDVTNGDGHGNYKLVFKEHA
jgi:hypothetical protein